MSFKIKEIKAEKILDSRKEETIKILVKTDLGTFTASSPYGKSTGKHETPAFPKSIDESIKMLAELTEKIKEIGIESFNDLEKVEKIVDRKKIGANTLYALEASILKALAYSEKKQLWELINPDASKMPFPVGNVIGGGMHTAAVDGRKPDFQEFLIIPKLKSFSDNVNVLKKSHEIIKEILKARKVLGKLNDEGAWSTSLGNEECLEILNQARDEIEKEIDEKIEIGIDAASSSFYSGLYHYKNPEKIINVEEQIEHISELADKFEIFYIEDPVDEEDFKNFRKFRERNSGRMIVGDDLVVSNLERFVKALKEKAIDAVILKPNQTGSLIEIKKIVYLAKKYNILTVMSHRSGETLDNTIADLAFGFQCDFLKVSPIGNENVSKLNRMIEIEKKLNG